MSEFTEDCKAIEQWGKLSAKAMLKGQPAPRLVLPSKKLTASEWWKHLIGGLIEAVKIARKEANKRKKNSLQGKRD